MRLFGTKDEVIWTLVAAVSAAGFAFSTRKVAEFGWKRVVGREPPQNPIEPGVGWGDALAWSAAAGLAAGLSRVLARRATAAAWQKATGRHAPTQ
jgi:hypothetical protein